MTDKMETIAIMLLAAFSFIGAVSLALFFLNISFIISAAIAFVYFLIIRIMTRTKDEDAKRTE